MGVPVELSVFNAKFLSHSIQLVVSTPFTVVSMQFVQYYMLQPLHEYAFNYVPEACGSLTGVIIVPLTQLLHLPPLAAFGHSSMQKASLY